MRGGYHIRISLTKPAPTSSSSSSYKQTHLDTSLFIPASLFQALPVHPPRSTARRYTVHHPRTPAVGSPAQPIEHRDYRFGPLRVDWVDFDNMDLEGAKKVGGGKEKEKVKRGVYAFYCPNPLSCVIRIWIVGCWILACQDRCSSCSQFITK